MLFGILTLLLPGALLYSSTAAPLLNESKRPLVGHIALSKIRYRVQLDFSPQRKPEARAGSCDRQAMRKPVRTEGEARR